MDKVIESKKRAYKKWIISFGVAFIVFLSWFMLHAFNSKVLKVKKEKIIVTEVAKGNFDEFIAVTGTVQPLKTVIVVALQGGIVKEKFLEDGAEIKSGVSIVELDNQDLQLEFMNRESALLDQLNNLRNTTINLEQTYTGSRQQLLQLENEFAAAERIYFTNKNLYAKSVISKEEFVTSEDSYNSLKQRVVILRESVESNARFKKYQGTQLENSSGLIQRSLNMLKENMEFLTVKAPADGQLTGFSLEIGQHVNKGDKVAEVDLLKGYRINAQVDELYIARVSKGLKAKISFAGIEYTLEVDKIYPQVNNGQFRVDLKFTDSFPSALKYGQTTQVRLTLSEPTRSLLVKKGGFYQKTGGNWIFVVEGSKAVKRQIKLGRQNPEYLEVLDGLYENETVVISGYDTFGDAEELILE